MSWFSNQWDRLSRAWDDGTDDTGAQVEDLDIVWGRERLRVSLPPTPSGKPTLGMLKAHLSQLTGIPYEQVKLVYHGLILKDQDATLRSYNIRSGSRIMLIGTQGGAVGDRPGDKVSRHAGEGAAGGSSASASAPERVATKGEMLAEERRRKEADRTENGVMGRIGEVVASVEQDVEPQLLEFERAVAPTSTATATTTSQSAQTAAAPQSTAADPMTSQQRQPQEVEHDHGQDQPHASGSLLQRHRLLNELLSRSLLQLDAIPAVSETTRARRKETVRIVQSLIDRLDAAWEKVPSTQRKD